MSKVVLPQVNSTAVCAIGVNDNSIRVFPRDTFMFSIAPNSHMYLVIELDGLREEVRFNGGASYGGVITVERGEHRLAFPRGAVVYTAITGQYLEDYVCQRAKECRLDELGNNTLLGELNNTWVGKNTFTQGIRIGQVSIDPPSASSQELRINSGVAVAYDANASGPVYGVLTDVHRVAGSGTTYAAKHTARAEAGATGATVGASQEVWNAAGAIGAITAARAVVYSQAADSSAAKVGVQVTFRNRPETLAGVVSGIGANKHNTAAAGILLDAQARSTAGEFSGWNRGIEFSAGSLDEAVGTKAVGIDFAAIPDAELTRIDSAVRVKAGLAIEWNGGIAAYDALKTAFNPTTAQWGMTWKGHSRFGINADNGMLIFADNMATTSVTSTTAGAASGNFLVVQVNGVQYKLELKGM